MTQIVSIFLLGSLLIVLSVQCSAGRRFLRASTGQDEENDVDKSAGSRSGSLTAATDRKVGRNKTKTKSTHISKSPHRFEFTPKPTPASTSTKMKTRTSSTTTTTSTTSTPAPTSTSQPETSTEEPEADCTVSGMCYDLLCSSCCTLSEKRVPRCHNETTGPCGLEIIVEEIPSENLCASDGKVYHWPHNLAYASCKKDKFLEVLKKGDCWPKPWWPWSGLA